MTSAFYDRAWPTRVMRLTAAGIENHVEQVRALGARDYGLGGWAHGYSSSLTRSGTLLLFPNPLIPNR
jgi:hypothetical protein